MGEAGGAGASDTRRLLIMASVVVIVSLVFMLGFLRGCAPRDPFSGYTVIYSNMDLKDASNVVTQLKALKIPYQIREEGRSVAVPKDKADEARLGLAQKSLPTGGSVGWEIFDTSKLGTTDFDRRVQFVRAISGELSRTIMRIDSIQDARVQIVIPQTSLFEVTKVPVTASVLLQLKTGRRLSKEQINGIVRLVASSVENLRPENVTIVDIFGNILSGEEGVSAEAPSALAPAVQEIKETAAPAQTREAVEVSKKLEPRKETVLPKVTTYEAPPTVQPAMTAVQTKEVKVVPVEFQPMQTPEEKALQRLKAKEEMENRLSSKAQVLVNRFFPPNSILVKVSLDLGEIKAAQKKPLLKKSMHAKKKSPAAKRKKAGMAGPGRSKVRVKKMTVIVLVDNRFNLTKALKKNAMDTIAGSLSYNPKRGDRIVIRQVPFHYATAYQSGFIPKQMPSYGKKSGFFRPDIKLPGGRNTLIVTILAAGALIFFVMRSRGRKQRRAKTNVKAPVPAEPKQKPSAVEQMRSAVSQSPEKVASLLAKWLTEEEGEK